MSTLLFCSPLPLFSPRWSQGRLPPYSMPQVVPIRRRGYHFPIPCPVLHNYAYELGYNRPSQTSWSQQASFDAEKETKVGSVIDVKDQDFDQQVLKSVMPVVVDYWAPWCAPCSKISAMMDKMSDEYKDRLKFCKVNVDENHDTAAKYNVMSLPTVLFFKSGEPEGQMSGGVSQSTLRSKLDELL